MVPSGCLAQAVDLPTIAAVRVVVAVRRLLLLRLARVAVRLRLLLRVRVRVRGVLQCIVEKKRELFIILSS